MLTDTRTLMYVDIKEIPASILDNLDLFSSTHCGLPCPSDSIMSTWSSYGPCYRNCTGVSDEGKSYRVRSRVVIKESTANDGFLQKPNLVETSACDVTNAEEPVMEWRTSAWNEQGSRQVWCANQHGDPVHGCYPDDKPPEKLECEDCGPYSTCVDGSCVCMHGFSGDGQICLPFTGCYGDSHCLFNNSFCSLPSHECICIDGSKLDSGK